MQKKYTPLSCVSLKQEATYVKPPQHARAVTTLDSPALEVMTDLAVVDAVTITPFVSIESANAKMIRHGVRLLLVVDGNDSVIGLITASDILGERPVKYMQSVSCTYSDILVKDIMTPLESIEILYLVDVERASVGDVLETLARAGRQHALIADIDEGSLRHRIRGIFSTTHISRMMNQRIEVPEVATSFAEVEMALHH
ncbi:MAG: CBS domain-containing protein [Pseudomonadota bacterium]